ncbi:MAG: DUF1178 family protein [Boseongicola sp.]
MIRYALKCENDHQFESWFNSAASFDQLLGMGLVDCPHCASSNVEKTLMAPRVPAKSNVTAETAPTVAQPMASGPNPKLEAALKELRAHVESNSEYVGPRFAAEATSMHLGDTPQRSIYGEVKPEEAKRLADDGVPALPLPFVPKQKTN